MSSSAALGGTLVIGVDPGPVPGIVGLRIFEGAIDNVDCVQVTHDLIAPVLDMLAHTTPHDQLLIGVERFVVGRRAGRSSTPKAGEITRDMVGLVLAYGPRIGATVVQASASQALPWSTDERLKKAGIEVPKGMVHAKAAARHALYTAVKHGHLPDPMSRKGVDWSPEALR